MLCLASRRCCYCFGDLLVLRVQMKVDRGLRSATRSLTFCVATRCVKAKVSPSARSSKTSAMLRALFGNVLVLVHLWRIKMGRSIFRHVFQVTKFADSGTSSGI